MVKVKKFVSKGMIEIVEKIVKPTASGVDDFDDDMVTPFLPALDFNKENSYLIDKYWVVESENQQFDWQMDFDETLLKKKPRFELITASNDQQSYEIQTKSSVLHALKVGDHFCFNALNDKKAKPFFFEIIGFRMSKDQKIIVSLKPHSNMTENGGNILDHL